MSTFNGTKFLNEQLESIFNQNTEAEITIYIRDDGSTDNTIDIINYWTPKINIVIYKEQNIGPARSFWTLFESDEIKADYYAFCDQDDIWDSDKLQIGIDALKYETEEALWCSNCRIIDQNGKMITDRMNKSKPDFTIISQFICGSTQGCAMLFNDKLRKYILKNKIEIIPMHDFVIMTYAIAKGKVIYYDRPTFGYRVHSNNVVASEGKSLMKHFLASFNRYFSKYNKNQLTRYAEIFLKDNGNLIDKETFDYINNLIRSKDSIVCRFKILLNSKTKSKNIKAERSFKIRVILGVI